MIRDNEEGKSFFLTVAASPLSNNNSGEEFSGLATKVTVPQCEQ